MTGDEAALVHETHAFARARITPRAAVRFAAEGVDEATLRDAASLGLLRIQVPETFGGLGMSFACKCRVAEALAAMDFGVAISLVNTHNVADQLARCAPRRIADALVPGLIAGRHLGCTALTEPGAGSDFAAIASQATRVAHGWRLHGRKAWIVNGAHADVIVAYAQTEPGGGAGGIAAFVLDSTRPGFSRSDTHETGMQSLGTGGFAFEGYLCSDDEMIFPPGKAFKAALEAINGARAYVAAMCCGMLAKSIDVASGYGATRRTFGRHLFDHQAWRFRVAEAAVDLEAARLLVDEAIRRIDLEMDARVHAARAKVFATTAAVRHIGAMQHAMGAEGFSEIYPLSRHLAAAQAATLIDGSTEMLLERIAKDVRDGARS